MAASEEAKEEQRNSEDEQQTLIKRKIINSDEETLELKGVELSSCSKSKPVLTGSKSVPLFETIGRQDVDQESDYGSESDLQHMTINETSLLFSQSYQNSGETHRSNGQPKVQFVEPDNRSKESGMSNSNGVNSPSKTLFQSPSICGKKRKKRLRSTSETSSISSILSGSSTNTNLSSAAPDGGYGWIVVAASFFVNMIADGVTFSFGIMFEEFQDEFESSSAVTAGVVSMFHAVPLMTGPIATWLTDRYGCRAVTIVGAILAAAGFLAAAFSHHIALLYLFFGVVAGFGLSLCYVASIIIVAYYFDRRRSFATGISVCGSGVGTFIFAPFTQWLMDTYGGWREACIILAGIFLNMVVCGMMFKELPFNKKKKMSRAGSTKSITSQMPEIEELRLALESGDVSQMIHQDKTEQVLASSLITIPTYIKDASKLPEDVLTMIAQNRKTYDYIVDNFPESLIAQSISELKEEEFKENDEKVKQEPESTGLKLKKRMSSILKGQKPILKKKEHETEMETETEKPLMEEAFVSFLGANKGHHSITDDRVQRMQKLRNRRQSMIYGRSCHSTITRHQIKASSCPDIYKNTVVDDPPDDEGCAAELTNCCSLTYLSIPFIIFCFSNFLLYFWYDVPYVYTIEYAENILHVPNSDSAQILSMIGVLNTVGEVLVGWLSDQPWMSSITLYAMCMCVCGVVTAIIPFVKTNSTVLILSAFYGFFISANYSLTSPILVDIVSIEQFSSAYGFLLACQGIGNLVGPPFAGWLYDYSQQWYLTFGLAGVFIAISGVMLVVLPSLSLLKRLLHKVTAGYTTKEKTTNCRDILTKTDILTSTDHGSDKLEQV